MKESIFEPVLKEKFPFWSELPEQDREYLSANTRSLTYSKGTMIHDGAECSGVILVRTGCLRVYMTSESGKEVTLYRLYPGDICMLSASCVIEAITFDVTIDAEENSECCVISAGAFSKVADKNPQLKIFSLETTVSRFSDVMWVLQQILFMSMDKRLAVFLLDEHARTGKNTIELTHEQIAKYIGSAREVVSRMLKYFSNEGIVSVSRKGITITDKEKLRKLAL